MSSSTDVNRRARYWTAGLGLLTLVVLALAFGKTAREQYYIWRLGSEDQATKSATSASRFTR